MFRSFIAVVKPAFLSEFIAQTLLCQLPVVSDFITFFDGMIGLLQCLLVPGGGGQLVCTFSGELLP